MLLKDLEIFVVGTPPPGWGGRYWIFVKLTTDNGVVGYGEVYASSVGPDAMQSVIEDVFNRHMVGENPENIELMFRRTYSSGFTQRPDLTVMGAFSGLEIACWDIIGKAHERPVYALLGGLMNERIRSYTYLYPLPHHNINDFWLSPEMAAESAVEMVKLGFTALKFDPAGPYTIRGGHHPSMYDIEKSFDILDKDRVYKKNKYNEANSIKFNIEGVGNFKPHTIFTNALLMLRLMLNDILKCIKIINCTKLPM